MAPLIPALNDHELERVLEAASAAGAQKAGYVPLRLFPMSSRGALRRLARLKATIRSAARADPQTGCASCAVVELNNTEFGTSIKAQRIFADLTPSVSGIASVASV